MEESFREEIVEEEVIEEKPAGPPSLRATIEEAIAESSSEPEKPTEEGPDIPVSTEAEGGQEPEPTAEVEALSPPNSWNKEDASHFAALPRPVQETILRRESERDRGTQQKLEEAAKLQRRYQELEEILEPHQTALGLEGKNPAQLVREHLAAEELMKTNPIAGIQWFCHHYGVNPQQLMDAAADQPQVDPQVQSLQQEIAQLKGYLTTEAQKQQLGYVKTLKDEVEGFAQETDSEGNLRHPHWETVKDQLPGLINLARTQNPQAAPRTLLEQAYNSAVRLSDDIWSAQQKAEEERRKAEQAAKVAAARQASGSISGAPSTSSDKSAVPKDLRSVIEAAWDGRL